MPAKAVAKGPAFARSMAIDAKELLHHSPEPALSNVRMTRSMSMRAASFPHGAELRAPPLLARGDRPFNDQMDVPHEWGEATLLKMPKRPDLRFTVPTEGYDQALGGSTGVDRLIEHQATPITSPGGRLRPLVFLNNGDADGCSPAIPGSIDRPG